MYKSAFIEEEKCNGCRICVQFCPEPNVIVYLKDNKKCKVICEKCKGCEVCVLKCPKKAISLKMVK
ncbi:MAG: 4Fe-4S binding protein [Endomicrobia bacterium]|nr:4Fe-4S binding protein [Endomicrobiia bacterium]MDW8056399.1 4Fe-4S dicluster-binding protein [Elusimicrobiota bacterium]